MTVPKLRELRLSAVLTQVALAAKAGVAEPTVVAAERGKPVRISTVRKLAAALGVAPQDLVRDEPQTENDR
jgi:transcriptional regulator with XRE-family HTH domain